jgi:hypothetical protein
MGPEIVTATETVVLEKEVIVGVPERLTKSLPVPTLDTNDLDTIDLGTAYKETVINLMIANGRLLEISNLDDNNGE